MRTKRDGGEGGGGQIFYLFKRTYFIDGPFIKINLVFK